MNKKYCTFSGSMRGYGVVADMQDKGVVMPQSKKSFITSFCQQHALCWLLYRNSTLALANSKICMKKAVIACVFIVSGSIYRVFFYDCEFFDRFAFSKGKSCLLLLGLQSKCYKWTCHVVVLVQSNPIQHN